MVILGDLHIPLCHPLGRCIPKQGTCSRIHWRKTFCCRMFHVLLPSLLSLLSVTRDSRRPHRRRLVSLCPDHHCNQSPNCLRRQSVGGCHNSRSSKLVIVAHESTLELLAGFCLSGAGAIWSAVRISLSLYFDLKNYILSNAPIMRCATRGVPIRTSRHDTRRHSVESSVSVMPTR